MEGYGNENPGAFQPTRPLRGATGGTPSAVIVSISTHAPLAGRDEANATYREANFGISTHAPLAGRDALVNDIAPFDKIFQPTRPLRGATGGG